MSENDVTTDEESEPDDDALDSEEEWCTNDGTRKCGLGFFVNINEERYNHFCGVIND